MSLLFRVSTTVLFLLLAVAFPAAEQNKTVATNSSSSNVPATRTTGPVGFSQRNPRYKVQDGDTLELDFPFTPEMNETVTVQPDGYINLRGGLKDMHVEGKTTKEIQQSVAANYASTLHDPVVNVLLKTFVNPYFVAYGEVGKPGKYDLHGDTTVAQAIATAGGFTSDAKHSQVLLFRRISDQWVSAQKVDVKHMLKSGDTGEDPHLQPGDMLYVPKSLISKMKTLLPWNDFVGYVQLSGGSAFLPRHR